MDFKKKLIVEQLDRKLSKLEVLRSLEMPHKGWINAIRTGLNMSLLQLAKRLKITSASVKEIEQREVEKTITLKKLSEAAEALGCKLVYGLIPVESSLEKMIEKRALEIAKEIVLRTSHSMKLEDQEVSSERIQKAIKDHAELIKYTMPKYLWE